MVNPATTAELEHGVPLFLDQLVRILQFEQSNSPDEHSRIAGRIGPKPPDRSDIAATAKLHGRELLKLGFSIQQVVYDYGDICQAISELAFEDNASIEVSEFQALNRCLDIATAAAVTEFSGLRDMQLSAGTIDPQSARRSVHADELMSLIKAAELAVIAIKSGKIGMSGATGAVLDRCLIDLRDLVSTSFADVLAPDAAATPSDSSTPLSPALRHE